jgi:hypothetical protein
MKCELLFKFVLIYLFIEIGYPSLCSPRLASSEREREREGQTDRQRNYKEKKMEEERGSTAAHLKT